MAQKQLTSPNKLITKFKDAASFVVKTTNGDYEIDFETAQKLSDLLLTSRELKFVKIKTTVGQVVINTSSIMSIVINDAIARADVKYLKFLIDNKLNKNEAFEKLNADRIYNGKHRITSDIFSQLWEIANEQQ